MYPQEVDSVENKIVSKVSKMLYELRTIEHSKRSMSEKYRLAKRKINAILKLLTAEPVSIQTKALWEELHDRQAYYYKHINKSGKNFYHVVLHNKVVPYWFKKRKVLPETVLHFDTHPDMGIVDNIKKPEVDIKELCKGVCGYIYHPITCLLWTRKVNTVVWCMPGWVHDTVRCDRDALTISDKEMFYIRDKTRSNDPYLNKSTTIIVPKKEFDPELYDFYYEFNNCRYRTATTKQWDKIADKIDDHYILDIDLDYFACNGEKLTKEQYKRTDSDICSTGRVLEPEPPAMPRGWLSKDQERYNRKLEHEAELVEERVSDFIKGLRRLKKKGKTPTVINISDSTEAYFTGSNDRAVVTNSYCPKMFVPYINHLLIPQLRKLFPKFF